MRDAFGDKMHDIGTFFENHDNQRFLWDHPDTTNFANAIKLIHVWIGIPILYYGAEQNMTGSFDPDNRRPLWHYGNYNQSSPTYKLIKQMNALRDKFPFDTLD